MGMLYEYSEEDQQVLFGGYMSECPKKRLAEAKERLAMIKRGNMQTSFSRLGDIAREKSDLQEEIKQLEQEIKQQRKETSFWRKG